jgi:DGQHR domain-containing protein
VTRSAALKLHALCIRQGDGRLLYSFGIDGKDLHRVATVSRISRGDDASISGYQRPEVISHVKAIQSYLESPEAMLPNALVIAFDDRVTFEAHDTKNDWCTAGTLTIPLEQADDASMLPGWIVDGQQRAAALREARVHSFPVLVTAFITSSAAEQRSQFILVNSTKPLPKGLIHELLPTTEGHLPPALQRRQFPSRLMERLNFDDDSPLRGRIRTPTHPDGVIKDNSVLKMLENSLSDGALYAFRNPETGTGDEEAMLSVVKAFWEAVDLIFGESSDTNAWNLNPRKSRLVHGVGIVSLGFVMDSLAPDILGTREEMVGPFASALEDLAPMCAWTTGFWEFGPDSRRRWNELQNTSGDIQLLGTFLVRATRATS